MANEEIIKANNLVENLSRRGWFFFAGFDRNQVKTRDSNRSLQPVWGIAYLEIDFNKSMNRIGSQLFQLSNLALADFN